MFCCVPSPTPRQMLKGYSSHRSHVIDFKTRREDASQLHMAAGTSPKPYGPRSTSHLLNKNIARVRDITGTSRYLQSLGKGNEEGAGSSSKGGNVWLTLTSPVRSRKILKTKRKPSPPLPPAPPLLVTFEPLDLICDRHWTSSFHNWGSQVSGGYSDWLVFTG